MALRDLEYQARVLTRFDDYLTELSAQKAKADKIVAANAQETDPDLVREVPQFPAKTWRSLKEAGQLPQSRAGVPFSPRKDGMGRPVPNAVLKVPTGGGKTYLVPERKPIKFAKTTLACRRQGITWAHSAVI
jgi:type III restriction enzyme